MAVSIPSCDKIPLYLIWVRAADLGSMRTSAPIIVSCEVFVAGLLSTLGPTWIVPFYKISQQTEMLLSLKV